MKKTRSRKKAKVIIEKENQDLVKLLKKMNLESNPELLSSSVTEDVTSPSCFLNLTPGPDDSAEISTIVNTICLRKKKPGRNHEVRLNSKEKETKSTIPSDSSVHLQKEETCCVEKIQQIPKTPYLNFSLNFSLGNLETNDSFQSLQENLTSSQDFTSTHLKPALVQKSENWDSFSTPPPLATRFSKLHL